MRNILLILFLTSNSVIFAQTIEFEKVTQTQNKVTKEILFDRLSSRLIEFIGSQDKYEKSIIQSDKDLGVIKFKQILRYNPKGNRSDDGLVEYNVNIFFKDSRFKIILTDIIHTGKGASLYEITDDAVYPHDKRNFLKFRKRAWIELKEYINIEMPKKISLFEELILVPIEQEKDW